MPHFDPEILIPLLAAHFLSDFVLQTDKIARQKGKTRYFLVHIAITLNA